MGPGDRRRLRSRSRFLRRLRRHLRPGPLHRRRLPGPTTLASPAMAEPVRTTILAGPAQRKREQTLLVRRSTTAVVSLAIILTGALAGAASAVRSGQAGGQASGLAGSDGAAALTKALADFEAAAARQAQAQAPVAAKQVQPIGAPRSAPAPASKPATVVSGGS